MGTKNNLHNMLLLVLILVSEIQYAAAKDTTKPQQFKSRQYESSNSDEEFFVSREKDESEILSSNVKQHRDNSDVNIDRMSPVDSSINYYYDDSKQSDYSSVDYPNDAIDRKDTNVKDSSVTNANSIRPNPFKVSADLHKFLNLPVHYSSSDKFPLISNSYANTKIQGSSLSNHKMSAEDTGFVRNTVTVTMANPVTLSAITNNALYDDRNTNSDNAITPDDTSNNTSTSTSTKTSSLEYEDVNYDYYQHSQEIYDDIPEETALSKNTTKKPAENSNDLQSQQQYSYAESDTNSKLISTSTSANFKTNTSSFSNSELTTQSYTTSSTLKPYTSAPLNPSSSSSSPPTIVESTTKALPISTTTSYLKTMNDYFVENILSQVSNLDQEQNTEAIAYEANQPFKTIPESSMKLVENHISPFSVSYPSSTTKNTPTESYTITIPQTTYQALFPKLTSSTNRPVLPTNISSIPFRPLGEFYMESKPSTYSSTLFNTIRPTTVSENYIYGKKVTSAMYKDVSNRFNMPSVMNNRPTTTEVLANSRPAAFYTSSLSPLTSSTQVNKHYYNPVENADTKHKYSYQSSTPIINTSVKDPLYKAHDKFKPPTNIVNHFISAQPGEDSKSYSLHTSVSFGINDNDPSASNQNNNGKKIIGQVLMPNENPTEYPLKAPHAPYINPNQQQKPIYNSKPQMPSQYINNANRPVSAGPYGKFPMQQLLPPTGDNKYNRPFWESTQPQILPQQQPQSQPLFNPHSSINEFSSPYPNTNKKQPEGIRRKTLPNILPQFRPNAKIDNVEHKHRPVSRIDKVQAPLDYLYPPPLPKQYVRADRREDQNFYPELSSIPEGQIAPMRENEQQTKVTTLQMMQQGVLPSQVKSKSKYPMHAKIPPKDMDKPVFVVYPISSENKNSPGRIDEIDNMSKTKIVSITPSKEGFIDSSKLENEGKEKPILKGKPNKPVKNEFPYPLVRPENISKMPLSAVPVSVPITTKTTDIYNAYTPTAQIDEHDMKFMESQINSVPYIQDYLPFATKKEPTQYIFKEKHDELMKQNFSADSMPFTPTINSISQSVAYSTPQPHGNNNINSNNYHLFNQQVTDDLIAKINNQREPISTAHKGNNKQTSPETHEFQAPFQASLSIPETNGWSAIKNSNHNIEEKAGTEEEVSNETSEPYFDKDNFKPILFGGFKPITSTEMENTFDSSTMRESEEEKEEYNMQKNMQESDT